MPQLSRRVKSIQPFMVMTVLERALALEREGINVVHFEIGEPDFDTPELVRETACEQIRAGATHYTHSRGILELREKIAASNRDTRSVTFDPNSEILVAGGTSPLFLMALGAILNPGDEVLISDPGYPCYDNFVTFFQGRVVHIPVYEEHRFDLTPDAIQAGISKKTRAIILNSPSNPTGQINSKETLQAVADLAADHDFWILSDEIYAGIAYDGIKVPSITTFTNVRDRTILLDGFSKFYAMTGWRLGYACAPAPLVDEMVKIQQNFLICPPSISQHAGIAAFECGGETAAMVAEYARRRALIVKGLNELPGVHCLAPAGAFYAFANVREISSDSLSLARDLLEQAHVAITPGIAFGPHGEGYLRFCFATALDNIREGLTRLRNYLHR
jgi:aspartate/methionine/tyrosine aminotransferase